MSQPPPPPLDIVHHPSLKNPHFWVMDVSTLRWVPQNELALSKGPTIVCSPSLLSTKRWRHTHSPKCCSFLAHDGETVKNTSLVCTNMLYWAGIIISTQLINNYIMECHSMAWYSYQAQWQSGCCSKSYHRVATHICTDRQPLTQMFKPVLPHKAIKSG
jgi:hypothetical protein